MNGIPIGDDRLAALLSKWRFGKFVSVGAVGAVVDTAVLFVLVELVGILEEVAVLVGIEVSVVLMFLINDNWTYAGATRDETRSLLGRLLRSHVVRSGGIVTQFIAFVLVYRLFFVSIEVAGVELWLLVAKAIGLALGLLLNYTFETLYTWAVHVDQ